MKEDTNASPLGKFFAFFLAKKTVFSLLLSCFLVSASPLLALDYYWVNGSGNWNDFSAHWATTSGGGVFHSSVPSSGDDVFFDFNSFPAAAPTVTININAQCRNITWAGVSNTPTLAGASNLTLTVYGNLTFAAAMNNTFAGKVIFSALGTGQTITSSGQTFANVDFTISTLSGGYILQDNFSTSGAITIIEGVLATNSRSVVCQSLLMNSGAKIRTLDMSNSTFTITGSGTPFDLSEAIPGTVPTPYLSGITLISNASSLINFTGAGAITINMGFFARTIPSIAFTNSTAVTLNCSTDIDASNLAQTTTFGNITVSRNNAVFTVAGNGAKNYGNVSLANNVTATFNSKVSPITNFNGTVNVGTNGTVTMNDSNIFTQNVTLGANTISANFTGSNTFNAGFSIGTGSTVGFSGSTHSFLGLIDLGIAGRISFSNSGATDFSSASIGAGGQWAFSSLAPSTISGTFSTSANCNNTAFFSSNVSGQVANVAVANTQTWNFAMVRDINKTGGGALTVANGANVGNNTNITFSAMGRALYWVGNSGNWNDSAKWSLTSGGVGGQCPPTSIDDVFFDANSFTMTVQTVNINVNAFCKNMSWAGVVNTPRMTGTNRISIAGAMTLSPNMLQTGTATDFSGDVYFTATTAGNPITMAGKTIANVRFEGLGGNWAFADSPTILNRLEVFAGSVDFNNQIINTGSLSTASTVDASARTVNFTASVVNINGTGTALNLSGGAALSLNAGTATINLTNDNNITVETGTTAKTIPNLIFTSTNPTARTATINTPSNANTITFNKIEVRKQIFVLNGTSPKVYNDALLFSNDVIATINGSNVLAENIFNGTVTFLGNNRVNFLGAATFNANVTFGNGSNLLTPINFANNLTFVGAASLTFGNDNNATFAGANTFRNVTTGTNNFIVWNNESSSFENLTANSYTSLRFPQGRVITINQTLAASVFCNTWISISSNTNGVRTSLSFAMPQSWNGAVVKDINAVASSVTATNSSDGGNNANVSFVTAVISKNMYWIGGASGNWSDGSKWSFTDGGAPAGCIPTPNDDVFFTNNSFPTGGGTCNIDIFTAFSRNMTWQNTTNIGTLNGTLNFLQVYGALTLNGTQTVNNFSGTIDFMGTATPTIKTITTKGTRFFGSIVFSNNDTWILQDDINIDNTGSLTLNYGTLDMNSKNVNLEGNLTLNLPAAGAGVAPQSKFITGINIVTFDGKNNNQTIQIPELTGASCITCSCSTSPFSSLVINKSTATTGKFLTLLSGISITNDFSILDGDVADNGFQIRGNAVGRFTMANNTALRLGSTTMGTVFPTCFTNANISISAGTTPGFVNSDSTTVGAGITNPAIVEYKSLLSQIVKGTTYGTLLLTCGATSPRNRSLDGAMTVNGSLIINSYIWLKDMGYQITGNSFAGNRIYMARDATMSLGSGDPSISTQTMPALGLITGCNNYGRGAGCVSDFVLPTGISLPPTAPVNSATSFPTFSPVGDFATGAGKMDLRRGCAVSYTARANQNVLAGFTYHHLYFYPDAAVVKSVVGNAGATLNSTGNLWIEKFCNLNDEGFQIVSTGNIFIEFTSVLRLGKGALATKFPSTAQNINIITQSNVIYNADVAQEVSTIPVYSIIELNSTLTSGTPVPKTFVPTNPVIINTRLRIRGFNNLIDNGAQIYSIGNISGTNNRRLEMQANSVFSLGNASIATRLPKGLTATDYELEPQFTDNSTIVYNSNQLQLVDRPRGSNNATTSFYPYKNLTIATENTASLGVKELTGIIDIDNNLLIKSNNRFNDNGFQISGVNNLSYFMTMEDQSTLAIGSAANATIFPSGYRRPNIALHAGSTVIYNTDNAAQTVSNRPIYGNLILRKFTASAPIASKTLANNSTTLDCLINGNLTVESFNNFIDNGMQISGAVGKTMTLQNNTQLTLGTTGGGGIATTFPNQFTNIDLSPTATPSSTVVFNSDKANNNIIGRNTAAVAFSYGNLTLSSNNVAVTKNLLSAINVRRNLTINTNNTLNTTASNFNINIGGNWLNSGGVFSANSGKVTFDGTLNQNITSNNSRFFSMEFNNPQGVTMLANMTAGGIVTFTNGLVNNASGQVMTFDNNATVAATPGTFPGAPGPSNNSFVNGTVRKIGNQAFMFPVGKVIDPTTQWFAPIGISAPTNATTEFTATYIPQNPHPTYNRFIKEPSINNIGQNEYWILNRAVTTDNVKVTLSWDTRSGGVGLLGGLLVAHWRSAAPIWWANGGNEATTGTVLQGTVRSSVVFDNFSPFTLGSTVNNNPLPVELITFIATPDYVRKSVLLKWQTSNEYQNKYFSLEKSRNGKDFQHFATVDSKAENGTSQTMLAYQEEDREPFGGLSYYRLRQTDTDGTSKYSKVIHIRFEITSAEDRFVVYPNPTEGREINIQFLDSEIKNSAVIVYDMLGKQITYQELRNKTTSLIKISFGEKLSIGSYLIKVIADDKVYLKKFVVY